MEEIIKDWQVLIGFGIAIAIFVWKVPSKNDLKELRTEMKSDNVVLAQKVDTLNQNFIDHLRTCLKSTFVGCAPRTSL